MPERDLTAGAAAAGEGGVVPSLRSLQRMVRRELPARERAGVRSGKGTRRGFDVYGKRPPVSRHACREGDHKRVPVRVRLGEQVVCPWVTWFVDVAGKVVVGVAVTPYQPGRDEVLAALRTGISRTVPYGPFGGSSGPGAGGTRKGVLVPHGRPRVGGVRGRRRGPARLHPLPQGGWGGTY